MSTKLDQLYSLRKNFTIIGLTGRTGSGCSELAEILSTDFDKISNIRKAEDLDESVFQKKYQIVQKYTQKNWKNYKVIEYKKVLLLLLLPLLKKNSKNKHLFDYYRFYFKEETDHSKISEIKGLLEKLIIDNNELVDEIIELGDLTTVRLKKKLEKLNNIFWGIKFNKLSDEVNLLLKNNGIIERIMLLHHTANNFRKSGRPFQTYKSDPKYIYTIAKVINRIIKSTKQESKNEQCHIVIDSLKNSLEINFFKERFSAFYLIAVKNDARKSDLIKSYGKIDTKIVDRLLEIDDLEYKCTDYQKGIFYTPDVQNCIQIADYHVNNNILQSGIDKKEESVKNNFSFFSKEEQLMKLQALIQQPGIITPDPTERIMQIAYTAKLNSGCISRQVGAVVTDNEYSTKAIGWNDVPKGAIPCSVRNVKDIATDKSFGFTKFELGEGLKETEQINTDQADNLLDNESKKFNQFVKKNFNETTLPESELGGRNCPYCFKTAYNAFSGEKNQVHTRSLHAEENAMMQISKSGGQGLRDGFLFTTASPCELCAKKAYQLGVRTIYYIDPYPGISRNHILKSNEKTDPEMVLFSGAVGKAYHKLYEPFLSQKDELALLTNFKLETPKNIEVKSLKALLKDKFKDKKDLNDRLEKILENDLDAFDNFIKVLEKGLN
ncbi:deoxycytidylate deaminase [Flavobacterium sp. 11]|uniref:deoxycytidylate deaminase n=1 Tax=Flavobacterium sp. 11 TaxID=357523 RepID=UPI000C187B07|nr:deoxycytidylate deaminase [Flavobacterium sp. 11]PIF63221.1 dCMP deaminase [Flavobacterium sp. 11]